jgi:hypothetical protein
VCTQGLFISCRGAGTTLSEDATVSDSHAPTGFPTQLPRDLRPPRSASALRLENAMDACAMAQVRDGKGTCAVAQVRDGKGTCAVAQVRGAGA